MNCDPAPPISRPLCPTTIDDLPSELLPAIFRYLSIRTLFVCGRVCKKWNYFVDEVKLRELIIDCRKRQKWPSEWFHTNRKINQDYLVTGVRTQQFLAYYKFDLSKLIRLRIFDSQPITKSFIEALLRPMKQLRQLELTLHRSDHTFEGNVTLDLPSLRVFKLFSITDRYTIKSPALEALQLYLCPSEIAFSNQNTIEHLKISNLFFCAPWEAFRNLQLAQFANVKVLEVCCLRYNNFALYLYFITKFKQLRTLKFTLPKGSEKMRLHDIREEMIQIRDHNDERDLDEKLEIHYLLTGRETTYDYL